MGFVIESSLHLVRMKGGTLMKKGTVYLLVTLITLSLGLNLIPNVSSQTQNVKILSYTYFIDSSGFLNVVGEAQNTGSTTVHQVYITAAAYAHTPSGDVSSLSYTQAWQSYLAPQQKAPFILEFQPPQSVEVWSISSIKNVTFTLMSNETDSYQYSDFKVTESSGSVLAGAYNGAYEVNGVIKNTGTQTAYNLTVAATFYNATGTVVAVGTTYEPSNPWIISSLAPSATVNFQLYASDFNMTGVPSWERISSYSLIVQSTGPMLQGIPPASNNVMWPSSSSGGKGSPTMTPTSTLTTNTPENSSPPMTRILAIAVAVIIIAVAVVVALLAMRRSKPHETVKETRKTRKQKAR